MYQTFGASEWKYIHIHVLLVLYIHEQSHIQRTPQCKKKFLFKKDKKERHIYNIIIHEHTSTSQYYILLQNNLNGLDIIIYMLYMGNSRSNVPKKILTPSEFFQTWYVSSTP